MLLSASHMRPFARRLCLWGLVCALIGPVLAHPGIDEQIADINARLADDPDDGALYLRRGELHRIHRDWAKAEADYRRALALDPELTVAHFCLARMKLQSGHPQEALAPVERFISRRPHDTEGLVVRGRVLAALGKHLDAARSFTLALQSLKEGQPAKPEYYLERAQALVAAGARHWPAALRGLDKGLARLGRPVTLESYAIDIEMMAKRYDDALSRLDRMYDGIPRRETWLFKRGEILETAGRLDQARAAYLQALEAIDALPPNRRRNRAVTGLEDQTREALERLESHAAQR